jgi:hypothetical protein
MKTSELTGPALDWAVAKCEGEEVSMVKGQLETRWTENGWKPSYDWAQGGPIIERETIDLQFEGPEWYAFMRYEAHDGYIRTLQYDGATPLIAAMRCYVASKLGDEIDVPDELK